MKHSNSSRYSWLLVAMGVVGCTSSDIKPVDIYPEDQCAQCRMAVSNEAFASEIITNDGRVFKFDDLGCLETFLQRQSDLALAAIYVKDYQTRAWLLRERSVFVQTSLKTPMASGKVAVADSVQAKHLAEKYPATKKAESDGCSCCRTETGNSPSTVDHR